MMMVVMKRGRAEVGTSGPEAARLTPSRQAERWEKHGSAAAARLSADRFIV